MPLAGTPCALAGPGPDALLWAQALERLAFPRAELRVLRDDAERHEGGLGASRDEVRLPCGMNTRTCRP